MHDDMINKKMHKENKKEVKEMGDSKWAVDLINGPNQIKRQSCKLLDWNQRVEEARVHGKTYTRAH